MEENKLVRKLVAIMFTDIYGYSRRMSRNEAEALKMLAEHDRIVEGVIREFQGNILKRMGDAVFAEFASSVGALNCAIRIQEQLRQYNSDKKEDERILVRIGLHLGDVVVKGEDLFGEGVNVAARLEPLADPGGICISESLYQSVRQQATFDAIRVGDVELKNILERYTIYKIPSPYPPAAGADQRVRSAGQPNRSYRIKSVTSLPVRHLSPLELGVFAFLFCAIGLALLAWGITGCMDWAALGAFLRQRALAMGLLTCLLAVVVVVFYSERAARIMFADVRDVDAVLEFLASHIGYQPKKREGHVLVFKPSLYHFILYSARTMRAEIDGNSVVVSGNYLYVGRLLRLVRALEAHPG